MAHKKVPGFIDEAVRTLERKNQGDLSLADETVQAAFDPTEGQKLLQAGSSAVAQVPADHGFVRFNGGMGAAAGPVATNDSTAMFLQYIRDKDEKDREARALELAVREKASADEREKDREVHAFELAVRVCVC